ncbi:hypothetical protein [Sphingomonas sp. 1P08PE]|uniref:hypothetical protein n=1 Tax=Sphingomonas sp. 1P08PE TaxID=554122 RepID=UPI0039A09AAE
MAANFERDRSVRTDMERVFGGAPALPDESPAPDSRPNAALPIAAPSSSSAAVRPVTGAAPQRSRRWLLLAAPVLAALFAIALAVRFALTLVPGNEAAPATGRTPPVAYSASAARPVPVAVGEGETAERDTLSPDDFGPAPVDDRSVARPAGAAEQVQEVPPPVRTAAARRRPAVASDCPPGSDDDRCIYRDVVGADRRLRAAYDDATQAGVPTDELVAVRRRWDRARAISLSEPDETIRRYDRLTERLDDLTRGEQH